MSVLDMVGPRLLQSSAGAIERSRRIRRGAGVHFYGGRNGSGKSLLMVFDTLPDLERGDPVLSTVRLTDYRNPRPCEDDGCPDTKHGQPGHLAAHPGYTRFTRWEQLMEWERGVVLMDEVTGVADSHDGQSLPAAVRNALHQMRREEVVIRLTGLAFINANKRLRQAVQMVTMCESAYPYTLLDDDGRERSWRPRRQTVARTYDAQSLPPDDHSPTAYDNADLLTKSRIWIPNSPALGAYNTFARISVVGTLDVYGVCLECDGMRRRHTCHGHDTEEVGVERGSRPEASEAPQGGGALGAGRPLVPLHGVPAGVSA